MNSNISQNPNSFVDKPFFWITIKKKLKYNRKIIKTFKE